MGGVRGGFVSIRGVGALARLLGEADFAAAASPRTGEMSCRLSRDTLGDVLLYS